MSARLAIRLHNWKPKRSGPFHSFSIWSNNLFSIIYEFSVMVFEIMWQKLKSNSTNRTERVFEISNAWKQCKLHFWKSARTPLSTWDLVNYRSFKHAVWPSHSHQASSWCNGLLWTFLPMRLTLSASIRKSQTVQFPTNSKIWPKLSFWTELLGSKEAKNALWNGWNLT